MFVKTPTTERDKRDRQNEKVGKQKRHNDYQTTTTKQQQKEQQQQQKTNNNNDKTNKQPNIQANKTK